MAQASDHAHHPRAFPDKASARMGSFPIDFQAKVAVASGTSGCCAKIMDFVAKIRAAISVPNFQISQQIVLKDTSICSTLNLLCHQSC